MATKKTYLQQNGVGKTVKKVFIDTAKGTAKDLLMFGTGPAAAGAGLAARASIKASQEAAKLAAKKAAAEAARKRALQAGVKVVKPGGNTQTAAAIKAAKLKARDKRLAAQYARQDSNYLVAANNTAANRVAKDAIKKVATKNGVPYPTNQSQITAEMQKAINKALNDAKLGYKSQRDWRYPYKKMK